MLFLIIGILIIFYVSCSLAIIVVDFNYIHVFFKYDAPFEIAVFKKEYKIKNKVFDVIAIILFLFFLPFNYNIRKGF